MLKLTAGLPTSSLITASKVVVAAVVFAACGTGSDNSSSSLAITAAVSTEPFAQATLLPTGGHAEARPTPTPIIRLTPVSDEELEELLAQARFFLFQWEETDFSIHSVPLTEIRKGGPGRDDIAPIDDPQFETIESANDWITDTEPVQVVDINGDVRAYPQQVLIWHEVVNDVVGGEPVLVTF